MHASTAVYDQARLDGDAISIDDAAEAAVRYIQEPPEEVNWAGQTKQKCEAVALTLHTQYARKIAPTRTYIKVELSFEKFDITYDDVTITLSGTTDRIYKDSFLTQEGDEIVEYGIGDVTTGAVAVIKGSPKTSEHVVQLGVYSTLATQAMGIPMRAPAEIYGIKSSLSNPEVAVGQVENPAKVLLGDDFHPGWIKTAAMFAKNDIWPGNPRSLLCSEKWCPAYAACRWRGM